MQALTDADYASIRTRIVDAIADKLALVNLAEIGTTKIYKLNTEDDPAQSWPGAVILRDFMPDQHLGGTNVRDDIGYPVTILLQDRADFIGNSITNETPKWDLWREKVDKAFRNQRLSGVDEVYTCLIEPGRRPATEPGAETPKIYLSTRVSLVVRALTRETRGIEV
jgi:hypothetical protein